MADALAPSTAPPTPRKRSFVAKLFRALLVLMLLLAVLTWFAPAIIARTGLLNTILAKAAADLNGTVTADGASLGWFSTVELRGVTVKDTGGHTVLTADTVSSSRTLFQLATDRGDLGTFTIAGPKLEVVVAGGTTNVETLIEKYLKDATPPKPERTPVKLELTGGTVVLREPAAKLEHTLTGLVLSLAVPRARTDAVTLTAEMETRDGAAPGKLKATAELAAGGTAKVVADSFAVGHLAPVLHRIAPNTTAAGALTADLTATWKVEEKKPLELAVDGAASATGVRLVGLAADPLALDSVSAPCKLSYAGGVLKVEKANVTCDLGSVEFAGTLDPDADPETLAAQAGLKLKARIDVAKLAAALPKTLRLRPGTAFRSGVLSVDISSTAGKDGPTWTGSVSTSPFEATRDGQRISWEAPLTAAFAGRLRADKMPHFDALDIRSDFLNANARGEPENFEAVVRANLGTLAAKVNEFADLGTWKLNGDATVRFQMKKPADQPFAIKGSVTALDLLVTDGAAVDVREPKVFADYWIDFERQPNTKVRLDRAEIGVTIGTDKLAVTMLKPVPDVRGPFATEAAVTLLGDLARWRSRIGPIIGIPADWGLAGNGTVTATAGIEPTAFTATNLGVNLTGAVLRIPKLLDLNEKQLIAKADARYDRKTNAVAVRGGELTSATVGATITRLDVVPRAGSGGGYGVTGTATLQTNLDSLQRTLLLRAPDGSDALAGLASGPVTFDTTAAGRIGFTADLTVKDFVFGPPAKPTHAEPLVKVKANGAFDSGADTLTLAAAHAERDGLAVDAAGTVAKLSTTVSPNLNGTITYDLAKVEPTVKEFLGNTAQVSGKGTKPFKLSGELLGGAPGTGTDIRKLAGEATVGWQSVKAFGFDVGAADLGGTLKDGIVYFSPVNATLGGGKVTVTPGLSLRRNERFLNFGKGKIVDHAKLTPVACADAIGFALPAIAKATQADGTFSFDLDDSRLPLSAPKTGTVTGRLTIHQANVSPGPFFTQVLDALKKVDVLKLPNTTVTLAKNNVVPIRFENGRVHHSNFTMSVDGIPIKTAGSVGVSDGIVEMEVEVPLGGKVAEQLIRNNPRIRDALAKQSLRIPIGGTLDKPVLDFRKYEAGLAKLTQDAIREVGTGLVEDAIKKNAGDIFKNLLPPKK